MGKPPKDVDSYIASTPKEIQGRLQELRKAIKEAAPFAVERISYSMPYYEYKGRVAYFRAARAHIGVYIPSPVIEEHQHELRTYETSKGTIRLPNDQPLPIQLIKKLIKARIKKNELNHRS